MTIIKKELHYFFTIPVYLDITPLLYLGIEDISTKRVKEVER